MQHQQIIHLCAGTKGNIGNRIANSGEDCGFSYSLTSSDLAIYTDKPLELNFELATRLIEIANSRHSDFSNSYFEVWRKCGDESPEFSYEEDLSKHFCSVFNFYFSNYHFEPEDLHLRDYKIETDKFGEKQIVYNFSSLYSITDGAKTFLYNEMMKSLTYSKFLKWHYKNKIFTNQIDATGTPRQVIPMATNNITIGISCGYVYPFDNYISISEGIQECICHRPIFTIFSSCDLPLSIEEANILNNFIDVLSPLSLYKEEQAIGDNIYRFVFHAELTKFITEFLGLLFKNRFKFVLWEFIPESNIEYINTDKIIRRYKQCVNVNAKVYALFNHLIHNDKNNGYFETYPVDCLYKHDEENDNLGHFLDDILFI